MHIWGDEDFDWEALNEACDYLYTQCKRYGRLGLWIKEKYGTMRVSTTCAFISYWPIHNLVKPGHAYYRWPRWVMTHIDIPLGKLLYTLRVLRLTRAYQKAVLKYFWKRASKKWPHIKEEILDEYNFYFEED